MTMKSGIYLSYDIKEFYNTRSLSLSQSTFTVIKIQVRVFSFKTSSGSR